MIPFCLHCIMTFPFSGKLEEKRKYLLRFSAEKVLFYEFCFAFSFLLRKYSFIYSTNILTGVDWSMAVL